MTQEFARHLTEISREINRQVGVLVNRGGYVEHVVVGNARAILLPDLKRSRVSAERFRGLRCLHTHLSGEELTQDDLTDLALLRLDLMAAIEVRPDGLPGLVRAAYMLPAISRNKSEARGAAGEPSADSSDHAGRQLIPADPLWAMLEPQVPSQIDIDFLDFMKSLEEEMARARRVRSPHDRRERAILVAVTTESAIAAQESLEELRELARSAGVVVLDSVVQHRSKLDPRSLLGRGKLEELIIRTLQLGADMIIFDNNLSPGQARVINEATDLKVVDRTQLILDIFAQRARSREGKIQVELAQLKYMLPRLSGSGAEMSRLMGGIGGRGPGETKLEVDRRRVRDRLHHLERQIEQIRTSRQVRRSRRERREVPVVSIVGYTNSGKSTLLNTLTKSGVAAENLMFATLDPTSRRLRLPRDREIVINDTVGFIRELPSDLIAAFRATLEEIEDSDLLIHLVDASSPQFEAHISAVEKILDDLGLSSLPRLVVFNKSDLLDPEQAKWLAESRRALAVSAMDKRTLAPLVDRVSETLGIVEVSTGRGQSEEGESSPPARATF